MAPCKWAETCCSKALQQHTKTVSSDWRLLSLHLRIFTTAGCPSVTVCHVRNCIRSQTDLRCNNTAFPPAIWNLNIKIYKTTVLLVFFVGVWNMVCHVKGGTCTYCLFITSVMGRIFGPKRGKQERCWKYGQLYSFYSAQGRRERIWISGKSCFGPHIEGGPAKNLYTKSERLSVAE